MRRWLPHVGGDDVPHYMSCPFGPALARFISWQEFCGRVRMIRLCVACGRTSWTPSFVAPGSPRGHTGLTSFCIACSMRVAPAHSILFGDLRTAPRRHRQRGTDGLGDGAPQEA